MILLLLLFSCGMPVFDVIKMQHNSDVERVKDLIHFFAVERAGFFLLRERENSLEFVRETLQAPDAVENGKVEKSRTMFLNFYVDGSSIYVKPSMIVKSLSLRKGTEVEEKNIRKSSNSLEKVEFNKREGIILSEILGNIARSLNIKKDVRVFTQSEVDETIDAKLIPSYLEER